VSAQGATPVRRASVISKVPQLFAIYVVYIFLAGWAFDSFYYRSFGVDATLLDLSLQSVLVRGFTAIFEPRHHELFSLYMLVISVSLVVELSPSLRNHIPINILSAGLLLVALFSLYVMAGAAGVRGAARDQGKKTELSLVSFSMKSCGEKQAVGKTAEAAAPSRPPGAHPATAAQKLDGRPTRPVTPEAAQGNSDTECFYFGRLLLIKEGAYYIFNAHAVGASDPKQPQVAVLEKEEIKDIKIYRGASQ
jgi:hypothetical protein